MRTIHLSQWQKVLSIILFALSCVISVLNANAYLVRTGLNKTTGNLYIASSHDNGRTWSSLTDQSTSSDITSLKGLIPVHANDILHVVVQNQDSGELGMIRKSDNRWEYATILSDSTHALSLHKAIYDSKRKRFIAVGQKGINALLLISDDGKEWKEVDITGSLDTPTPEHENTLLDVACSAESDWTWLVGKGADNVACTLKNSPDTKDMWPPVAVTSWTNILSSLAYDKDKKKWNAFGTFKEKDGTTSLNALRWDENQNGWVIRKSYHNISSVNQALYDKKVYVVSGKGAGSNSSSFIYAGKSPDSLDPVLQPENTTRSGIENMVYTGSVFLGYGTALEQSTPTLVIYSSHDGIKWEEEEKTEDSEVESIPGGIIWVSESFNKKTDMLSGEFAKLSLADKSESTFNRCARYLREKVSELAKGCSCCLRSEVKP